MLVLSRHPNEDILFPNSGIRIRILSLKGNVARVGIEAPPEVQVLRAELAGPNVELPTNVLPRTVSHDIQNQMNKVTLGLHRFQQQWHRGLVSEAEATFQQVLDVLEALDQEWPKVFQRPNDNNGARRCRTLLVEDDANERELLAGILSLSGCDCDTAVDGQEALDYLASHEPPDLVLLDMGIPRVSGPQTLDRIRQEPRWQRLKVFAVSGSDPKDHGISVGGRGVDAWFRKPLSPTRLREVIRLGLEAVN